MIEGVLESLQDDWLGSDERDLLDAVDEIFDEIEGSPLGVDQTVSGVEASARLQVLQKQGWFDFVTDADTTAQVYSEAVKRLHRRVNPVQAPVFEAFSALRLLQRSVDPAAAALRAAVQSGETALVLDFDSLFTPRPAGTGRGAAPFSDTVSTLVVVDEGIGLALHVIDPAAVPTRAAPLIDPTLPVFRFEGTGDRLASLSHDMWAAASAEVLIGQANAFVGQAQSLLSRMVAYLRVREQFGVPIGTFQALRHRAADVAAEVQAAQHLSVHISASHLDGQERRLVGLIGKSLCGRAAVKAASEAVQLRGGMGFTWEDGTHFGLKRIMSLALTGPTIREVEQELGTLIAETGSPRWAGGL